MTLPLKQPDEARLQEVLADVALEFRSAAMKFDAFTSSHHGYAVLKEEVDELWDDIKANKPYWSQRAEAIQIAAMAVRFILDIANISIKKTLSLQEHLEKAMKSEQPREKTLRKQGEQMDHDFDAKGQSGPGPEYHEMMEDIHQKAQRGEDI